MGHDTAQAANGGENAGFPTAFLADYMRWDAIDATSARATISLPGIAASAIFHHVDDEGHCTHVTAERYREEHRWLMPRLWTGRWDGYREVDGPRVPPRAESLWTLDEREHSYFRVEVTEITANQKVPL